MFCLFCVQRKVYKQDNFSLTTPLVPNFKWNETKASTLQNLIQRKLQTLKPLSTHFLNKKWVVCNCLDAVCKVSLHNRAAQQIVRELLSQTKTKSNSPLPVFPFQLHFGGRKKLLHAKIEPQIWPFSIWILPFDSG